MKMNKIWRSVQNRDLGGRNMAQPSPAGELNAVDLESGLLEQWAAEKTFQALSLIHISEPTRLV